MVKLTQIDDETFENVESKVEASKSSLNESDESESESDLEDDDFDYENETVYDRIIALKDIIAPEQRDQIANLGSTITSYITSGINSTGSLFWTLTSSALLLGVPLSLAILAETQLQEMEKDISLQQSAQDVLAPGSEAAFSEKR
ncbi:mitochondrial outer membrane translocase complex, subunit Tom22 [Scheffersomyces amazonensis]|uniref:mitochondrial outer membrane translocase complex, subunit Tom22 n=1 Tax=Scheffersomyces amazonensis TaxID=1078765 RepID=UPI00315DF9E6